MGARDLGAPDVGARDLTAFQVAGKTLYSLGLIEGSEGNLSTFDGRRLLITRTGARLFDLSPSDLLEGTPDRPPPGASSDLAVHLREYRRRGPGAVAHAHPPGTVPEGAGGGSHGVYEFGETLEQAVGAIVARARGIRPIRWVGDGTVLVLDQTRLPAEEVELTCRSVDEVAGAIRRLAVRGAPALGIAAAYGLALAARASRAGRAEDLLRDLEEAGRRLTATRPTAVNIAWAVDRVLARARATADPVEARRAVLDEAIRIEREDAAACAAMGRLGRDLVPEGAGLLTHCNTGMLCTGGIGTAQGVIYAAHVTGKGVHVFVPETRPVLQGARLTAWELQRLGVPMTLVADTAVGHLMQRGRVDLVLVGADRIAMNGDVANKIGTYTLAVLARRHRIPFYVVAPTSSIDPHAGSGGDIEIEERDPAEVTSPLGVPFAPRGTRAANPAFDLTPAGLVTAIVTERGVVRPPYRSSLRRLLRGGGR